MSNYFPTFSDIKGKVLHRQYNAVVGSKRKPSVLTFLIMQAVPHSLQLYSWRRSAHFCEQILKVELTEFFKYCLLCIIRSKKNEFDDNFYQHQYHHLITWQAHLICLIPPEKSILLYFCVSLEDQPPENHRGLTPPLQPLPLPLNKLTSFWMIVIIWLANQIGCLLMNMHTIFNTEFYKGFNIKH